MFFALHWNELDLADYDINFSGLSSFWKQMIDVTQQVLSQNNRFRKEFRVGAIVYESGSSGQFIGIENTNIDQNIYNF